MKRHQDAIKEFTKAISLQPGQGIYLYNRSLTYNSMGNKSLALKDALKAKQLGVNVDDSYTNSLR